MTEYEKWLAKAVGCKIGTVPMVVQIHGKDKPAVGKFVRIKRGLGYDWQSVYVNRVDPDGHFQADQ